MTQRTSHTVLAALLAGSLVLPALAQSAGTGIEFQSTRHQIPAGTSVKVKLLQGVSSSSAELGQRVRVQVAGDDTSGLPAGAIFNGRVASVTPANPKAAGVLRLKFGSSGGSSYAYNDTASAQLMGTKPVSDKSQYTSIGAGAGALLGFMRKRKLGDAIGGAVVGGAAGYGANQLQKKSASDVSLKSGDEITIKLDRPLTLQTQIVNPY